MYLCFILVAKYEYNTGDHSDKCKQNKKPQKSHNDKWNLFDLMDQHIIDLVLVTIIRMLFHTNTISVH